MTRRTLALVVALLASACGGELPTTPSKDECTHVVLPDGSVEHGCPGGQ